MWVRHYLGPESFKHQRNFPRPRFIQSIFYPKLRVDGLYTRTEQRATLARILKSEKLADKLISSDQSSYTYLARGHLAAKADFVFGSHQMATFYHINAAPQWQTFNGGNWLAVELGIKPYINRRNISAELYTGTYGVVQYQDAANQWQDFYLAHNNSDLRVPVPKLYYKIVLAREQKQGIVFIGVNNPHATLEQIENEYVVCPDVSNQVKYISWDRRNVTAGYSYACSVNDFVRKVPTAPTIPNAAAFQLLL